MQQVIPWCAVAVWALAATAGAQPTRLWTRFLGPTNAGAQAFAVNVGADHNVYVAGKAYDGFDGQPFVGPHTDAFMTKFNPDGVRAWTRLWGSSGSKNERAMGIGFDSTGRVYVAGESAGNFDGNTNGIEGYELMFLSKFTTDGTGNWSRLWGDLDKVTPQRTQGYNLAVDGADCLYVVGETGGEFDGQTNAGVTDLCVSKLDASGTRLWTRIWGGGFTDHAQAASVDSAGNLYVAGATSGSGLFSGFDGQTNPSPNKFSACISKFTPNGTRLWSRIWGSSDDDRAYGVAIDKTDSVYVSGVTRGKVFDGCTNSPSQYATFLTKFDSAGMRLWSRLVAARNETQGRQVCFSPSDNALYVSGMAYVWDQQFALTKFDLSGNQLWHVTWGSSGDDYAEAVGVSDSGEIYVAGASLDGFDGWTAAPEGSAVVSKWVDLTETTDSDCDGMTDLWEMREFANLTHDGTADSDFDGARDRDEFVAGTSPTNRNSCFQIDTCFRSEDRDTVLAWRSVLGRTYAVDVSTNLDHGWTTNVEAWIGTGAQLHYTNHNDGERSFFRLKVQQTGK